MKKPRNQRPRILLVSNSLSTGNRKALPAVRAIAEHYPALVHLEGADVPQLYRQLDEYRGAAPELLILNGGDGTLHTALTYILNRRIFRNPPPVAVLAGGMTNMVANDLGTGGAAAKCLTDILDRWQYGDLKSALRERNLLRVDVPGWKEPQYGFFFDAALVVSAIRMCRDELYPRGITGLPSELVALVAHVWGVSRGAKPGSRAFVPPMKVKTASGAEVEGHFGLVAATTLRRLLLGAKANAFPAGHMPVFTMRPTFSAFLTAYWNALQGTVESLKRGDMTFAYEKSFTIEGGPAFIMEGEVYTPPTQKAMTVTCAQPLVFVSFSKE
ncbi:MAG TPA: diacylglycerol kinase family protein [Sphingomonadales bacterium]|nr:diacylglycerol kinase family protein [Sphingomonadales bacterium]